MIKIIIIPLVFFLGMGLFCWNSDCWELPASVLVDRRKERENVGSSSRRKMTDIG